MVLFVFERHCRVHTGFRNKLQLQCDRGCAASVIPDGRFASYSCRSPKFDWA